MENGKDVWTILAANPPGEGFGFNGDILETNLLNLAAVLAILFKFGKELVSSLLEARKQAIVKSLEDAEQRYQEAFEKLQKAQAEFVEAQQECKEIRLRSDLNLTAAQSDALQYFSQEKVRIEETKNTVLSLEEAKIAAEIYNECVRRALEKTSQKIQERMTPALGQRIINLNIEMLGSMTPE
jgi:F-type H+-transporting ATPase subunit b